MRFCIRSLALGSIVLFASRDQTKISSVRGYPADQLDSLRAREAVLRDTPDTAMVNQFSRIMSEEPNHAGSR
jgi:hypothetical protein